MQQAYCNFASHDPVYTPVPNLLASGGCVLLVLTAAVDAFAQNLPAPLRAVRIDTAPTLDGLLDDQAWAGAPQPLQDWVSYNPMKGEPAAERTRVWIAYDHAAVYFAFECLDSEPERIRSTISRRDNVTGDDWVGLSLDSSRAGQLAYHLFVNPHGIQMDALQSGTTGEDFSPDWVWQSAARIGDRGWSAEIRIPLENIRFKGGRNIDMGVMFWRHLSRTGVSSSSPAMPPGKGVFDANTSLVFDELRARRLVELIPSTTFSGRQDRRTAAAWNGMRAHGDVGVSAKVGLTSAVTLDATINPDFSQVESDVFEVEVNQRFPVFFSEKRPFFMEGMGLFNLAGTGNDSSMRTAVHTRTIVDPSAGLKLTGTAGRHTFGLLAAGDASPEGERQRTFLVAREVLNLARGQYAGVLFSNTRHGRDRNLVIGGDTVLRRGERFSANGAFLSSHSSAADGERSRGITAQGSYSYSTRRFGASGQLEHYDRGFRMDTAFANRVGMTRTWQYQGLNFHPSGAFGWVKRINPFFFMVHGYDRTQGGSEALYLPAVRFNFTRAGYLRLDYMSGHETFAGRRFDIGRLYIDGGVQMRRWLNVSGGAQRGPAVFYDAADPFQGERQSVNLRVTLQPSSRFNSHTSYSAVSFIRQTTGEEAYSVHIVNVRNTFQFTPRFFVRAVAQFDSLRERVLTDFLASYEPTPGTVIHAGYGAIRATAHANVPFGGYLTTARALFVKASYRARF